MDNPGCRCRAGAVNPGVAARIGHGSLRSPGYLSGDAGRSLPMSQALEDQSMEIGERPRRGGRRHTITVEPSPRRVRVIFNGTTVADSTGVLLLLEAKHLPVYYFPVGDVRMDLLQATDHTSHCPYKGEASYWSIKVDGRISANAVWSYQDPLPGRADIKGYLAFYWDKVDAWFE